jgi:DNA-binding transcriptional regulator YhcF (GntR family)
MYEHLYRCIKQDILQKKLKSGEKLPSKRAFAKNLGVSTITVESAYAQLVAEGYLYSLPKRGYYVCGLEREEEPAPPRPVRALPKQPVQKTYWADFVGSSVAKDMFPFSVWVKLLRDVTAGEDETALLTDTSAGGIRQLRQAIADHLYQFRGMAIDPEQIVVGAGMDYLLDVILRLLPKNTLFGIENHLYSFYDHPDLYREMCEVYSDWLVELFRYVFPRFRFDFMTFAEDMSYNNGPMIYEELFNEFMLPYYEQMIPMMKEKGTKVFIDSDGDISMALDWFMRAGIEGILPLERQAGVDLEKLRARYPKCLFIGHYDKMVMPKGEDAMRAEFERLLPIMKQGGFVASVDHQTPPGVSLENYYIYLKLLREYAEKAMQD